MRLDWIAGPIGQYSFLALALIGCLVLFFSMKKEIALMRRSFTASRDSAAAAGATASRPDPETADVACLTGQPLNLTRRDQALRMQRRGESPALIAGALRLPRNEVDLLLKVQKLTDDHGLPAATGSAKSTRSA